MPSLYVAAKHYSGLHIYNTLISRIIRQLPLEELSGCRITCIPDNFWASRITQVYLYITPTRYEI